MYSKLQNVVITAASSYNYETLRPFFKTLNSTGYKGRTILFLGEHTTRTYKRLQNIDNLKIVRFIDEYPFFIDHKEQYSKYIPKLDFNPHPKTLRYLLTKAYLLEHRNELEFVLTADSRDVVFQKDPFEFQKARTFYAFQEDTSNIIKTNNFNSLWIKEAFGEDALNRIGNEHILCSGVSIGYINSFIDYLSVMEKYILRVKDQGCKDQGIHNYIIHNKIFEDVIIMEDDSGPVSTISYFKPSHRIKINDTNLVMNIQNEPIHIVHQYDRIFRLYRHYSKINYLKHRWRLFKKKNYHLVKPFKRENS